MTVMVRVANVMIVMVTVANVMIVMVRLMGRGELPMQTWTCTLLRVMMTLVGEAVLSNWDFSYT
jgi:hypothetical protein